MKVKYLDRVLIPKGFYEGERGVAIGYRQVYDSPILELNPITIAEEYEIQLDRSSLRVWIKGKELEKEG